VIRRSGATSAAINRGVHSCQGAACKDGRFSWILRINAATKQNRKEKEQQRKKGGK
jgi:hypothetical protein